VQPIDMIKTRLQLAGEGSRTGGSFMTVTREIIKNEGFFSMYKGLSAGLLRQATYTTARMGLFRTISDSMAEPGKSLPFYKKVLAGTSWCFLQSCPFFKYWHVRALYSFSCTLTCTLESHVSSSFSHLA
jgi:hypothetical protein